MGIRLLNHPTEQSCSIVSAPRLAAYGFDRSDRQQETVLNCAFADLQTISGCCSKYTVGHKNVQVLFLG